MKELALRYCRMGLSVIPIKERGKEPLIKWQEFQKRRASPEEVAGWFTSLPNANIGVVTGAISGCVVVDLDGPEGLDTAKSLALKSPVVSMTGKGKHLWYQAPEAITQNSVRSFPGLDIRGDGGFVVVPPSIHESGKRYCWLTNFRLPLPQLPKEVCSGEGVLTPSKAKPSGWMGEALALMSHGNIDDTLFKVASRMRNDGWTEQDAFVCLQPIALSKGATEGHVRDKIHNVWNRYEPKKSVVVDNEEAESAEEFLASDEKVEWIAPGLLAKNSIAFCVGLPESNKTWLCMDLAVEASLGGEWLGLFPVGRTKTLFIDQERWSGETRRRFRAILASKNRASSGVDNLHIKSGSSIKLDLENSYNAFVRLLEKIKPELVIIDSLATFHTKEENSRSEIQSVMEKVKQLREQFGCTFLFISHANKFAFQVAKEGQEPALAEMAGSIALPAAAETVFTVQKQSGGGSTVFHSKSTLAMKHKPFGIIVEDVDNGIRVRGVK